MGKFGCFTFNNSSPNGKHKVYLCAHADELVEHIDSVSKLIFKINPDLALWYYDESAEENISKTAFNDTISEMRLFIVPVTEKFLDKNNRSLNVDLKYAKEHHVPTLILLQKEELTDRFNSICGKLHVIKKNDENFEDKIERFITLLFADKKLKRQITKSFDAKIFLSYRKRDRNHAKKLIKLIHGSFKNVGIWFDDYLTSGEKFDSEILAAIKDCDFMALAVTPNVLNKPNYVEKKEYPKALDYGKRVIPIELIPTDKKQLSDVLDKLDTCINITDKQTIVNVLGGEIKNHTKESKLTKDEKDYFIGLAYFMGVNAPHDAKLGFEMILRSANAGNHKAMNKLYQIYRFGDYVEADYKEAIRWKLRYIRKLYDLRYTARYSYQRKAHGLELVYSSLELIDYNDELLGDHYLYDSLDKDFLFTSQDVCGDGSSSSNYLTKTVGDLEGNLPLFAGFLYESYPSAETIVALAKSLLYQGSMFMENSDYQARRDSANSLRNALSLLEKIPDKTNEIKAITAEICIAKAILTKDEEYSIDVVIDKTAPLCNSPLIQRDAVAAVNEMQQLSSRAIELLNEIKLSGNETTANLRILCRAYNIKASSCFYDWKISKNSKLQMDHKKYLCLSTNVLEEIVNRHGVRQDMVDLRDRYNSILFKAIWADGGTALFGIDELRVYYKALVETEESLLKKWNIEKRFSIDPMYNFLV